MTKEPDLVLTMDTARICIFPIKSLRDVKAKKGLEKAMIEYGAIEILQESTITFKFPYVMKDVKTVLKPGKYLFSDPCYVKDDDSYYGDGVFGESGAIFTYKAIGDGIVDVFIRRRRKKKA